MLDDRAGFLHVGQLLEVQHVSVVVNRSIHVGHRESDRFNSAD
jgi:hypothetical protein